MCLLAVQYPIFEKWIVQVEPDESLSRLVQPQGYPQQDHLGPEFIEQLPFDMMQTWEESTCFTPIFFVLFPGGAGPGLEETAEAGKLVAREGR